MAVTDANVLAGGNVVTVGGGPITVQLPAVQTVQTVHRMQAADRMETAAAVASVAVPVIGDTRTVRIGGGQGQNVIRFHRFE